MRNEAVEALSPEEGQKSSLFDDDDGGDKGIKRAAAGRQVRTLVIVLVILAAAISVAVYFVTRGSAAYVLSGYKQAVASSGQWKDDVQLSASVELKDSRSVVSPEKASMGKLYVEEGDWVKAGAVLAQVVPLDLPDQLKTTQDSVAAKERSIAKLKSDHGFSVRKSALDLQSAARAEQDLAKQLSLKEKLHQQGSLSDDEYAAAQNDLAAQKEKSAALAIQVEQEQATYDFNLAEQSDGLDSLKSSAADLQSRIAACTIRSPIDGKILQIEDAAREVGAAVSQNAALITVADTRKSYAKAKLPESDAAKVKAGMKVTLVTDAQTVSGKVERVGALAKTDDQTYGTYFDLFTVPDDPATELTAGASVSVGIDLGTRADVLQVQRGPWYSGGSQDYVYLVAGAEAVKTKVKFGSTSATGVEIVSGLKAGDAIISSDYRAIAAYDRVKLGNKE